jgi:hypothetical protein
LSGRLSALAKAMSLSSESLRTASRSAIRALLLVVSMARL